MMTRRILSLMGGPVRYTKAARLVPGLWDDLPEGMVAEADPERAICYIRNVPHTLIDCLEVFVGGWRDVLYLDVTAWHHKLYTHYLLRKTMPYQLFTFMARADRAGYQTLAFIPRPLDTGVTVWVDVEGNVRPSVQYDPYEVKAVHHPVQGLSLGADREGRSTMTPPETTFTVNGEPARLINTDHGATFVIQGRLTVSPSATVSIAEVTPTREPRPHQAGVDFFYTWELHEDDGEMPFGSGSDS